MIRRNNSTIVEAPPLTSLVEQLPEKITLGSHIKFLKPIHIMAHPVIDGSLEKLRAEFGSKAPFKVSSGKVIIIGKDVIYLKAIEGRTELLVPIQHTSN